MLAGVLALLNLPVAQFPPLAPPAIAITVTYPGASAETVENTVVQPIEQQMSGLDNLIYMSSESDKDGSITITLSFAQGTNPNIAQVQVQNKLQLALPRLPQAVQQQGLRVAKAAKNILLAVAFVSTDDSMQSRGHRRLRRLPRTGSGEPHPRSGRLPALRRAVRDAHLARPGEAQQLRPDSARCQQCRQGAEHPGRLRRARRAAGRRRAAAECDDHRSLLPPDAGAVWQILLRVEPNGAQVRLRDVARISFGGENYSDESEIQRSSGGGHSSSSWRAAPTRSTPSRP